MSSKNTTSYVAIVKLIEACGTAGVKSIKINDTEIQFYDNGRVERKRLVIGESLRIDEEESIDLDEVVSDNGFTDEDVSSSEDILADTLEDLQLSDPLAYEELLTKELEGIANDKTD